MRDFVRCLTITAAVALSSTVLEHRGVNAAPELPSIAFAYGGVPSSALLPRWARTDTNWTGVDAAGVSYQRSVFADPETGVAVTVKSTRYARFPAALEWELSFRNGGAVTSRRICNVSGLHMTLPPPKYSLQSSAGTGMIHRFRGSAASAGDFAALVQPLAEGATVAFGPYMGRSSDHALPLFAIGGGNGGVVASVGWSGSWQVNVRRSGGGTTVDIWHGAGNSFEQEHDSMGSPSIPLNSTEFNDPTFCAALQPGEAVRLMRVLLVQFEGPDVQRGFNLHRQLVQRHKLPRDARTGELLGALVASDADGLTFPELMPPSGDPHSWSCPTCAARQLGVHLPGLKAIGGEALWLDACLP